LVFGLFEKERGDVTLEDAVQAAKALERVHVDAETKKRFESVVVQRWGDAASLLRRGSL